MFTFSTRARPAAGLLFGLAGITDYFDGYLARRLGLTSNFGAFLDPVADKLIVSTALVLLVQADPRMTLALGLSAALNAPIERTQFGIFRM